PAWAPPWRSSTRRSCASTSPASARSCRLPTPTETVAAATSADRLAHLVPSPTEVGIRVLIVDDHPVVREGFSQLFEFVDGIEPVGTAAAGDEALDRIAELEPDLVLLDLQLPGDDGATVAGKIKERWPDVRVVIFTGAP